VSLLAELKRRNVFRVGVAYLAAGWLLVEVLSVVLDIYGAPAWVLKVVVTLLALGLPIALVFSWAYEITPGGLMRTQEVDRSQSITHETGGRLDRITIGLLLVAIAVVVLDRAWLGERAVAPAALPEDTVSQPATANRPEPAGVPRQSIAVLAFDDMSPDHSQEYLSDGIAEELLNLLAKIPDLRVAARTSSFSFKGQNLEIPVIAARLGVAHVLEGSVRKSGSRVRITAQLIQADTGFHVWSETWDRTEEDVFAIQDEIAAAVVAQLRVKLLGEAPRAKSTDHEAYELFLQARHLAHEITARSLEDSNAKYRQALTIDPEYAPAWVGLSSNYANQANYGLLPSAEGYALAREAAMRALASDPAYAPVQANLGWLAIVDGDLLAGAQHFERALQLDPTDLKVLRNAASLLQYLGRVEQAIDVVAFVTARDPLNPKSNNNLAVTYIQAGRWAEARDAAEVAIGLSPDLLGGQYLLGEALLGQGEAAAALAAFGREADEFLRLKGRALALHALGRQEESRAGVQELAERWGGEWACEVAEVYGFTGDADAAFDWLDRALVQKEFLSQVRWSALLRRLHADPRWTAFWERAGLSQAQLDAIPFEVTLPATGFQD